MDTPNTVAELQALALERPNVEDSAVTVAAWYEHKATVLAHLAEQGSAIAATQAPAALRHAHALVAPRRSWRPSRGGRER